MKVQAGTSFLFSLIAGFSIVSHEASYAQSRVHDRIAQRIEESSTHIIRGNVHPLVNAKNDRGVVSALLPIEHVTMFFKPTDEQQANLNALIEQQLDPASRNYHQWLSPEEFADRFGLSPNDINKVVGWLKNLGLTVNEIGRNRSYVTFSGSAGQVGAAFDTSIHQYIVNGKLYYGNAADPSVPAAFADLVLGFHSLNNFPLEPRAVKRPIDAAASPKFTSSISGNHYLSPDDFTTIYDFSGLYSTSLDGTGQTIAVAGQTDIQLGDIEAFRTASGLPANDPQVILVPGVPDPGVSNEDLVEADLDLEWAGATAPKARILYVNSNNALVSLQYAIDQNLAPVVSVSYGMCEKNYPEQDVQLLAALGQRANVQGITILAASGDNGAADCESDAREIATHGMAVDLPASLPSVTGIGGSEFRDVAASWSSTNDASNGSALAGIPEVAWNDTTSVSRGAGGGGRSIYFSKPLWQTGNGVPNDSARDVPDISLNASPVHDGYLICSSGSCLNGFRSAAGGLIVVGGTSVGAPAFAGIVALINQEVGSPQGNINSVLYRLASTAPSAFRDITSGGNQVPCQAGTPDCTSAGVMGYTAGPGYDQATGLGSVDVARLVAFWPTAHNSPALTEPSSGSGSLTGSAVATSQNTTAAQAAQPIPTLEQGSVHSGYMVITPDSTSAAPTATVTFGIVSGGVVQSQTDATPSSMVTDSSFYADVIPGIGRNLGIAIVNFGSVVNTVTISLRDPNGNAIGNSVIVSLAPRQQTSRFVNELFSPALIGSRFLGSLRVQSSSPVGLMGLRFAAADLSAMPLANNSTTASNATMISPQFAMGGGWATQLALVNNNGSTVSGQVDVLDTSGNPMVVSLNGVTQSSFGYSIPPSGIFVLAPRDANGQTPF